MFEILVIICFAIFGVTAAETENDLAILKRLDATESLVFDLLREVDILKSQDRLQRSQIARMETQLRVQNQRNSKLKGLIRRLKDSDRKKNSIKSNISTVLSSKKHLLHADKGTSTNRNRRAVNENPVAFFAKMVNDLEHGGVHQNVIFDSVVTNIGNGYNMTQGEFIAPVAGTYVFSTTLVSRHFNAAHAQFIKNGAALTTMYVSAGQAGTGDDTTSQTIVLQLKKGEYVSVQNLDPDKSFTGTGHSIFSGFLLQEDYSSSVIVGK